MLEARDSGDTDTYRRLVGLIVQANHGLAYVLVRRYNRGVDPKDALLIVQGAMAKACDSWDPAKAQYNTYVEKRVQGALSKPSRDAQRHGLTRVPGATKVTVEGPPKVTKVYVRSFTPEYDGDEEREEDDSLLHDHAAAKPDAGRSDVYKLMAVLTDDEREVMTSLNGLFDVPKETPKEVAARMGICRQRVQQLRDEALAKMRASKA